MIASVILAVAALSHGAEPPKFSAEDVEFFEKEVRPILVARCYECHSGKTQDPKGGLRLDSRAAAIQGGDTGPAVVPGDSKNSLLVDAINYGELYQMPPKSRMPASEVASLTKWVARGAPWPDEAIEKTARADGFDLRARKAAHWCWQPVQTQAPPVVANHAWPRKILDHFVLAKLEAAGLQPAQPADKATLIRRVYFDLIGLPPSPDELHRFLHDDSPQAFERVVDQLLDSPHFGERWARHWMDLVRYAETCGHEFDYPIHHAWRYRDYLIRAFNADVPYDQLITEHIAGDLLTKPRLNPKESYNESIIGTGFWFLHEASHAPVDVRGDQAGRVDNQIDVFSKTFLGLTVSCARCHDHKFDAISTQDYYALSGFLHSSRRQQAMLDPGGKIHQASLSIAAEKKQVDEALDKIANFKNVSNAADGLTSKQFARHLLAAREFVYGKPKLSATAPGAESRPVLKQVAEQFGLEQGQVEAWAKALCDPALQDTSHPLNVWKEFALREEAPSPQERAQWLERTQRALESVSQVDADYPCFEDFRAGDYRSWFVTGEAFGAQPTQSGDWDANANTTSKTIQLSRPGLAHSGQLGPNFRGVLRSPSFTINHRNIYYRVAGHDCEVRLIVDGYTMIEFHQLLFGGLKFSVDAKDKFIWHRQSGDLGMYLGHRAYIEVLDNGNGWGAIDEIRFSDRDSPPPSIADTSAQLITSAKECSLEALAELLGNRWQRGVEHWRDGALDLADTDFINWALRHELLSDKAGTEIRHAEEKAASARRRIAEFAGFLATPLVVTAMTDGSGEDQPIFIRGNPRTPGDMAPRQLLVALVDNQPPSALSDGSGRLVLAQQIASPANPLTARVMANRLWHHLFGRGIVGSVDNFGVLGEKPTHPELLDYLAQKFVQEGWSIKRLIRTIVLSSTYQMSSNVDAVAAERDPTNQWWHHMPVRRLQAEAIRDAALKVSGELNDELFGPSVAIHITPFMQGRGKPDSSGPVNGAGRRSVYIEVRRNFLSPLMMAFDAPIPFNAVGRRNLSNVPAQALILMNDPFFVEQSDKWSKRLLENRSLTFEQRIERAYLTAFARPPSDSELARARAFFATQSQALAVPSEHARMDQRVWADYCHVLFNTKEFIFVR